MPNSLPYTAIKSAASILSMDIGEPMSAARTKRRWSFISKTVLNNSAIGIYPLNLSVIYEKMTNSFPFLNADPIWDFEEHGFA